MYSFVYDILVKKKQYYCLHPVVLLLHDISANLALEALPIYPIL
jgi:hypothetical protein